MPLVDLVAFILSERNSLVLIRSVPLLFSCSKVERELAKGGRTCASGHCGVGR